MDLLRRVGFIEADLLHKKSCLAAFDGRKGHPMRSEGVYPESRLKGR
jgi:hypothetical protein